MNRRSLPLIGLALAMLGGCADRAAEFHPDTLLHLANELTPEQSASVVRVLDGLFGTPEAPRVPPGVVRIEELFTADALQACAGPVASHRPGHTVGLYRRHCARCHGVTGDGAGPTALYQSPAPRDFRPGVFKWKSTERAAKPTAADLDLVLQRGVAGSSMPGFALVAEDERRALRQYVVYLSVRGELERALVALVAEEFGETKTLDPEADAARVATLLGGIVDRWREAPAFVVRAPSPSEGAVTDEAALVASGHDLYHSAKATCTKCHGQAGEGIAEQDIDYDDWTRERMTLRSAARGAAARQGVASERVFARAQADTRPDRPARGRQLVGMPLRGGDSHEELFARVQQGIAGTPMPALGTTTGGAAAVLSDDEVLAIATYVRTLIPHSTGEVQAAPAVVESPREDSL